jgi:hypothetical protein
VSPTSRQGLADGRRPRSDRFQTTNNIPSSQPDLFALIAIAKRASCKIHLESEDFSGLVTKSPVAQAFQPVQAQAEACGYILQEAQKFFLIPPSP